MKAKYLFIVSIFLFTNSYSQFLKNEKFIGGNLDILSIKEKNSDVTGSGPFGSTSSKETDYSFRPEFNYIISKNLGVSIFGEFLSSKYTYGSAGYETKTKGYGVGLGVSKYKFFTKGFGIFGKIQLSYSPSSSRYYDTSGTYYPKDKYNLSNASLLPGLFYRFTKHFTLQASIGKISYDHLVSKREGIDDSKIHNQFSASFSTLSFGAFYVFK